jgi:hypothetical protein
MSVDFQRITQRYIPEGKYSSTEELLGAAFSLRSDPKFSKEDGIMK